MNNKQFSSPAGGQTSYGVCKAVRKTVSLGGIPLTAYMMPSGEYTLASNSATSAIHKHRKSLCQFLESKSLEALSCQGFSLWQIEGIATEGSVADIKPIPLHVAIAYWNYWNRKGNKYASNLLTALANGHMMTLLDDAFGVQRSTSERDQALADMLHPDTTTSVQQVRAEMKTRLEELESQLAGVLWQKVSELQQLSSQVQALSKQEKQLAQQNSQLIALKEELEGQVYVLSENLKDHQQGMKEWCEKARWAQNMKQLADRKINVLEKQVSELTGKLQAAEAKLAEYQETVLRDAQAMAKQILASRQL